MAANTFWRILAVVEFPVSLPAVLDRTLFIGRVTSDQMRLCFLFNGLPAYEVNGKINRSVRSSRMWSLVGFLALRRGCWINRNEIAQALWPDTTPAKSKQNLRQVLLLCSKTFGKIILVDRVAVKLDDVACECDIWKDGVLSSFFESSTEDWVLAARPSTFASVFDTEEALTDPSLIFLQKLRGTEFDNTATSQFQIWVSQGRYDEPIQLLQHRRTEGTLSLRGHGLLANLYQLKGLHNETRAVLDACLDFEEFKEDIYYLLAFSQFNHFQYRLDLALEYANLASSRATLNEPYVFFGAIAAMCMLTEPQKHLPIAQKYYQIAVKNQFKEYASLLNYFTALSEVRAGNPKAQDRLDSLFVILSQNGREGTTAKMLARVGQLYHLIGHHDKAEDAYLKALAQARRTEGIQNVTEITTYLAEYYTEHGELTKALAYHAECVSIRRDLGHQWGLATSLRGAGFVSMKLHDHLQAEAYLRESLRIYETLGDMMGCASVLLPFAQLYFERKHFQKSMRCAVAVKRIFGDADDAFVSKSIPTIYATLPMLNELFEERWQQEVNS